MLFTLYSTTTTRDMNVQHLLPHHQHQLVYKRVSMCAVMSWHIIFQPLFLVFFLKKKRIFPFFLFFNKWLEEEEDG
jgi:hypothetical protein